MKHILIVTQYFWPEQFRINDISQSLLEKGYKVTVFTGLPNYPSGRFSEGYSILGPYYEDYNGVNVVRVPLVPRGGKKGLMLVLNYLSFFLLATLLCPFLIRGKVDRIFVYQLSPVTAAFPAVILKWIKKAPIIFWVTDLWPETLQATGMVKSKWALGLWGSFVRFLYNQSDRILVTSKGFIERIASRGIPKDKLEYWPQWGEDLFAEKVSYAKNTHPDFELSLIPQGFKIMFAGNIGTSQAFETIVDAAEKLKDHTDIHWIVLGDGLKKKWVEEQVSIRNLKSNFHLLGRRPLETMPLYYSQADILLASLKKDPLFAITVPAKIQSYLPSGKPVLVSMDGEGARLIEDAHAGVSCRASDSNSLAEGVMKLYFLTRGEREEMGKRGREYFFSHFNRESLLKRLETILEQ